MITTINSIKLNGKEPLPITIEGIISPGVGIHLVGLADEQVKESLLRTITALTAYGYHIPGNKIIINIAPSDVRKSGSGYDLAVALTIINLSQEDKLPDLDNWLVLGELGLDGSLRDTPGVMQAVLATTQNGLKGCIVPQASIGEFIELFKDNVPVYAAATLADAINIIKNPENALSAWDWYCMQPARQQCAPTDSWAMLKGQDFAKRALEIAAAGRHNLLVIGPVGSGKTTIAKALMQILPPMTQEEIKETEMIYSVEGRQRSLRSRPFRAPHYSASLRALLGGGAGDTVMPGEVSLAHNGVLYLDEVAEAPKALLEGLRGPLEDKKVIISRLRSKTEYPADFQLVLSSNPCPCGYYGIEDRCTCSPNQRIQYLSKLSGPVMDRITVMLWAQPLNVKLSANVPESEPVEEVAERVRKAREIQSKRFEGTPFRTNEDVPTAFMDKYFHLGGEEKVLVEKLFDRLGLSARAYTRILKMARTIADLESTEEIKCCHLAEAASYRFLDRSGHQED